LRAETEHVHVVVLDALVRGVPIVADRGADAGDLRSGDRGAHARAADKHTALGRAGEDRVADLARLDGIVDPRLRFIRSEVNDLVPEACHRLENPLPQLHSAVVESDRNLHRLYVTPPRVRRLRGMTDPELWRELGQQLRVDSIRCSAVPKSGHPTS